MSARCFLLTHESVENHDDLVEYVSSLSNINYYVSSIGEGGVRLFCQFSKPSRLSLSKLCGAVVNKPLSSPQRNIDHVKEGREVVCEWGTARVSGGRTIGDIKAMAAEEIDDLPWMMYRAVGDIRMKDSLRLSFRSLYKDVEVYYIWGESGVGKTTMAKDIFAGHEETHGEFINRLSYNNGFWEGVDGETRVALYDDFRDYHMRESEFVRFVDYNVQNMNIKGGMLPNVYSLIVITSIQSPYEIYPRMSREVRQQWLRRMEIIHLTK